MRPRSRRGRGRSRPRGDACSEPASGGGGPKVALSAWAASASQDETGCAPGSFLAFPGGLIGQLTRTVSEGHLPNLPSAKGPSNGHWYSSNWTNVGVSLLSRCLRSCGQVELKRRKVKPMRRLFALGSVVVTSVVLLAPGVGTAAANPHPGGCPAFGAFMGAAASASAQNEHPLGQAIRQLTPFGDTLAVHKAELCG